MKFEGGEILESQQTREVRNLFEVKADMIDHNGHVSSGIINRLFEEAQVRGLFGPSVEGDPVANLEAFITSRFIKKQTVEYQQELKMGERGDIATRATLGNSSITYTQTMYNQRREVVAEATYVVVMVDEARKPVRIPDAMRRALLERGE